MAGLLSELIHFMVQVDMFTVDPILELRHPLLTKGLPSVTGLGSAAATLVFLGLFYLSECDEEFLTTLVALSITGVVVWTLMATSSDRSRPRRCV